MKMFQGLKEFIGSNPKKFLFLFFGTFVVLWFLFGDYGFIKLLKMENDNRILLERSKRLERRIIENERRIRNAYSPDSIEKAARERYNFRREGERLYIIRGNYK